MSIVTFVGVAFTRDGTLHQPPRVCSADELRDAHPAGLKLNFAHDKAWPLGEVASFFRCRETADVWAVAVGSNVEPWLLDGPLFFSPEWTARPDGSDIEITGLAVCVAPATVGLRSKGALTVFDGDLRDAGQWFIDGKRPAGLVGDVLRDARDQWRQRHSRSALRVGGHNLDDYPWSEGEGMPLRLRDERPAGKLRRSGGRGRILRVS